MRHIEQVGELRALYVSSPFTFIVRVANGTEDSEVRVDTSGELVFKGPLTHCLAWIAAKDSLSRLERKL